MFSIYRNRTALTPLTTTWEQADAPLREAILLASRKVDEQLQSEPHVQGESRGDGTRILFQAPLGVTYEVDEGMKLVRILRAWAYRCVLNDRGSWE
jgi:hypothetical protein